MNDQELRIKRLAVALERLTEFVPKSKEELDQWYEQARSLQKEHLFGPGGLTPAVPYFLWHYLSDADIRMKSEAYAEVQGRRINLLIQDLKRGVMPSDDDA